MSLRLLDGKSAVITGAGSGVGKAAALLFAGFGIAVLPLLNRLTGGDD